MNAQEQPASKSRILQFNTSTVQARDTTYDPEAQTAVVHIRTMSPLKSRERRPLARRDPRTRVTHLAEYPCSVGRHPHFDPASRRHVSKRVSINYEPRRAVTIANSGSRTRSAAQTIATSRSLSTATSQVRPAHSEGKSPGQPLTARARVHSLPACDF